MKKALPSEHTRMIEIITKLPPVLGAWTRQQEIELRNQQGFWQILGQKLDYLQQIQLGYRPKDPLESYNLSSLTKQKLDIYSRYIFALLALTVQGWDHILETATSSRRDFPFNNPRELITEICRQQSIIDARTITDERVTQRNLGAIRVDLRKQSAFYRDRLENEVLVDLLEAYQFSNKWEHFIIFAIWKHRYCKTIWDKWKAFLDVHKEVVAYWNNKKAVDGCKLIVPQWRAGHAIDPKSSKPISFSFKNL